MSQRDDITALLADLPEGAPPALIVDRVTHAFDFLGSQTDAEGVERFMPGVDRTYGVRIPDLRKLAKQVVTTYKKDPGLGHSVAVTSWARGSREHRMFAVFVIDATRFPPEDKWALGVQFLPEVVTWEDCDQLCGATLGYALSKDAAYMDQLETWLDDENFWVRRAALVSTVYLRRAKYEPDTARKLDARALAMCEQLLEDEEPYVRKAVDWAIREVIGRHYDLGRDWLMTQARRDLPRSAQTVLKLSAKKLTDDDQEAFLAVLGET